MSDQVRIHQFFQPDERPTPVISEEDGGWWAGTQVCFTGVAIAGAIATESLAAQPPADFWHQDYVPPPAAAVVSEDYDVQVPHTPVPETGAWLEQWEFEQHEDAANLHGVPEETGLWIGPPPVIPPIQWLDQWEFEQHEDAANLHGALEETGLWPEPPPEPPPIFDLAWVDDVLPQAAAPAGNPTEDFWIESLLFAENERLQVLPQPWEGEQHERVVFVAAPPVEDYWPELFMVSLPPTVVFLPEPWATHQETIATLVVPVDGGFFGEDVFR